MTVSPRSDRVGEPGRRRPRFRALPAAVLVVAVAVLTACTAGSGDSSPTTGSGATSTATFPRPEVTPAKDPLLIKHGWDVPTPEVVRDNAAAIDALPFDGLTVALPDELSARVQTQDPLSAATISAALEPLQDARLSSVRHNFVMAYAAPAGDLFDDWTVPVENFGSLATAARDAGLHGIFYDIEEYFGDALRYPESCGGGREVDECREQARRRGREVMSAIVEAWPRARVLTTFGPWLSEPLTAEHLGVPYDDVSWANPLSGSFVVGMVEATVGTRAQVVDGGEVYTPRTEEDFVAVRTWVEHGMPALSPLIPDGLRDEWADTVSAGFGVYDRPWAGADMDVDTWGPTLAAALATTERYVWAYTERHDWLGTGWPEDPVPPEWVDATRSARSGPSPTAP